MDIFIRDIRDWSFKVYTASNDWEIVLFDTEDSSGRVSVPIESSEFTGNWLLIGDKIFYISSTSPKDGATDLTISEPYYAFNRTLVYHGDGTENLESFICNTIINEFVEQSDEFYSFPYITCNSLTTTSVKIDIRENEEFNFIDILQLAKEKGIQFDYSFTGEGIHITVAVKEHSSSLIFFNDGHTILEESALSDELVAKVTVRKIEEVDEIITVLETQNYYWHEDGTITTSPPDPRLPGRWEIVSFKEDEDSTEDQFLENAKEAMDKNDDTYKIVFYSDRVYLNGDKVNCKIGGAMYLATITCCKISTDNSFYYYRAGNLPTKLTEKLIDAVKKK